tara:strand:+ start:2085 stop:2336 length:252 start_codon:yes stop_codon:yes gene_type:complete
MDNNIPMMTKYEYTRIRGIRIQQLVDGMLPFVKCNENDSESDIFEKELKAKKIPLLITRPTGFDTYIKIPVSEMNVDKFINID